MVNRNKLRATAKERTSASSKELKNTIVVHRRDGSIKTKTLTDKQFHALQVIIGQYSDAKSKPKRL